MSTSTETPSITQTVTTERNHKHPEAKSSTVPRDVSERSSVDIRPKMPPIPTAEEETLPHHAMVKSESFKITRAPLKDADNSEPRVKKEKKGKGRREKNGSGSMDGLDAKSKRRQSESSAATSATASDDENDTRSTGRSSVTGPPSHTSRKKSNASAKERDLHPKEYGVSRILDEEVKKKVVRISADSLESGYTSSICSNESLLYAPPKGILKNPQSTMSSTDSLEGTHGGASGKGKKKGLLGLMNDRRKSHGSTDWRESITFASEDKDEDEEENGKESKSRPSKTKHNFRHSMAESHEGSRNSLSAPTGHHKSGGASPRSRLASNDSIDWATPRGPGVGGSPNMRKKQLENKNRVFAQDASDTQPKESTSGSQPRRKSSTSVTPKLPQRSIDEYEFTKVEPSPSVSKRSSVAKLSPLVTGNMEGLSELEQMKALAAQMANQIQKLTEQNQKLLSALEAGKEGSIGKQGSGSSTMQRTETTVEGPRVSLVKEENKERTSSVKSVGGGKKMKWFQGLFGKKL